MTNHSVRIGYLPRLDHAFQAAIERACLAASLTGVDIDTPDAALIAEDHLRSHGYPNAAISLARSVQDYRNRISRWHVRRDGRPGASGRTERPAALGAPGLGWAPDSADVLTTGRGVRSMRTSDLVIGARCRTEVGT